MSYQIPYYNLCIVKTSLFVDFAVFYEMLLHNYAQIIPN